LIESLLEIKPSVLAFSNSFCVIAECTQLVAEDIFAIVFLVARCFTRIYHAALGGYARAEEEEEIGNGGSGEKALVNSKIPHYPFMYLPREGSWAETWRKERKRQPTNGQKLRKLQCCPQNGSHLHRVTYSLTS
jgi:hypothetical protein